MERFEWTEVSYMDNCGIYRFVNTINGKSYVGRSVNLRHRYIEHIGLLKKGIEPCTALNNAWKKYGQDAFIYEVVCLCEPNELNQKEEEYIELYDSFNNGYNCTKGGSGMLGYHHTDEAKEKIGVAFRGKKLSEEHKKKMSEVQKGKHLTPEHRKALSDAWTEERKQRFIESRAGINHPNYGKVSKLKGTNLTEEHKEKLKKAWTPERRKKISEYQKGVIHPSGGAHPGAKRIIANTGEEFDCIRDAAKWCGVKSSSNIGACCRGLKKHVGKHPITKEPLSWSYL